MRTLFRRHPYVMAAFLLAATVTLFFAVKVGASLIYWSQHDREPVRPWMTVGYIGRSWGLDPHEIDVRAGFPLPQGRPPHKGHPLTLIEIAAATGVPVTEVVAKAEATVAELLAEKARVDD